MADFIGNTELTGGSEWQDVTGPFAGKVVIVQSASDDHVTLVHFGPTAPTKLRDGFTLPIRRECYPPFRGTVLTKLWVRTGADLVHISEPT